MSTPAPSPLHPDPKPTLLTLPPEIRQQIYTHAFSHQSLWPFPPLTSITRSCTPCLHHTSNTQPTYYASAALSLLTCRSLYREASPLFHSTLTLNIADSPTLDTIRKSSPYALRRRLTRLSLFVHLDDTTRFAWQSALTKLVPSTFPSLTFLQVHNHMRSPTSYDRLVDAIYLASPLVLLPAPVHKPPGLQVLFAYVRDETMFESPFLGEITTADSLDAHEQVVREVLTDDGFKRYAREGDFDGMMGRLLGVARGREEEWLEGLQRRRLAEMGLTLEEVVEMQRVQEEEMQRLAEAGVDAAEDGEWAGHEGHEGVEIRVEVQGEVEADAEGEGEGEMLDEMGTVEWVMQRRRQRREHENDGAS